MFTSFLFSFYTRQSKRPNSRATANWFCGPSEANMASPGISFMDTGRDGTFLWRPWAGMINHLIQELCDTMHSAHTLPHIGVAHPTSAIREMRAAWQVVERWKTAERKRTQCTDSPGWGLEPLKLIDVPVQFLSHLTYFPFQIFPLCCIIRNIFGLCLQFLARSS